MWDIRSALNTRNPLTITKPYSQIARFMRPTWDPLGADRTQVGPMLAPWTVLSGLLFNSWLTHLCSDDVRIQLPIKLIHWIEESNILCWWYLLLSMAEFNMVEIALSFLVCFDDSRYWGVWLGILDMLLNTDYWQEIFIQNSPRMKKCRKYTWPFLNIESSYSVYDIFLHLYWIFIVYFIISTWCSFQISLEHVNCIGSKVT